MPSGSQRSSQEGAPHSGRGRGGSPSNRRTAGGSRQSGGSGGSTDDHHSSPPTVTRMTRTSTTGSTTGQSGGRSSTPPATVVILPTKEELASLSKEERANKKKELLLRVEMLRAEKHKKIHDVETKKLKVQQMQSSLFSGIDAIEKKEEQLTNTMLRKIEKLEKDKTRLTQHLEQEEASKFKMEKRLRSMKQENIKLKEDLRAEERSIMTKLQRPLEGLKKQRVELERKLEAEHTPLIAPLQLSYPVIGGGGKVGVLSSEVATIKETGLLSSSMAMSDGGFTDLGLGEPSSSQLLGGCGGGVPSESDIETPRQPGAPRFSMTGPDSRPSSVQRHRSTSTRSLTGGVTGASNQLTTSKLLQLQDTRGSGGPFFSPVRSPSRRSDNSSVVCESFGGGHDSPDILGAVSKDRQESFSAVQTTATSANGSSVLGANPHTRDSFAVSETTPRGGVGTHSIQQLHSVERVGGGAGVSIRTFTPLQGATSAPVQYPFPARYIPGGGGVGDDVSTSCCSSGRSTPAFTPVQSSLSRDNKDAPLVDDSSMMNALRREIKRLKQLQRRTQTRTAVNESKIQQLQDRVLEARQAHEQEVSGLCDISNRLQRTSSLAHELGAQNEATFEWSTDRSLHGAPSTHGSLASSSVAAPFLRSGALSATGGGGGDGLQGVAAVMAESVDMDSVGGEGSFSTPTVIRQGSMGIPFQPTGGKAPINLLAPVVRRGGGGSLGPFLVASESTQERRPSNTETASSSALGAEDFAGSEVSNTDGESGSPLSIDVGAIAQHRDPTAK